MRRGPLRRAARLRPHGRGTRACAAVLAGPSGSRAPPSWIDLKGLEAASGLGTFPGEGCAGAVASSPVGLVIAS